MGVFALRHYRSVHGLDEGGLRLELCINRETRLSSRHPAAFSDGEQSMARITLRQLLDHAAEHDYGIPAFNINNMEQGLAIMEAAAATDAPVIIQASRGARAYANDIVLSKLIEALIELYHRSACTLTMAIAEQPVLPRSNTAFRP